MSSDWDWDNGDDMIKAGRVHPLSLEAKRQLLIDAARHNLEEEVDELESLTAKGVAFDDAVAQTLTKEEIADQDRAQVGEELVKAYQLVREIRASNKAEVEQKYLERCRAIAEAEQNRAAKQDETEFFSLPEAAVDFSLWIRKKHWHLEEAVALWRGKNPKIVNPEALDRLRRPDSPFVREFQERLNTLQRALDAGHIPTPLTSRAFIDWAIHEDFSLPAELRAKQRTSSSEETETDEDINPKTHDVFYKVLVGMAIKHYRFDPNWNPKDGAKSDAFSKMMDDINKLNLRVDVKTLRTHMAKALKRTAELGLIRKT
jgi:hypothetical protein